MSKDKIKPDYLFIDLNLWVLFANELMGTISYTKKSAKWKQVKVNGSTSSHAIYNLIKFYCDTFGDESELQDFINTNIVGK